ncbi:MAG TPA: hypothetical protein VEY08_12720 [Chloroflexia bacterium]|nr:hypothetical protein [Chloroflexia bacterium]
MTWTNALGLCPRCEAAVEGRPLVCPRCGLDLVVPAYLAGKVPPELDTTVLQPVDVSHRAESKLPAMFVLCAVGVVAAGMLLAGANRSDNTARATSQGATATPTLVRETATPTRPAKTFALTPVPSHTPLRDNVTLPTSTAVPPPPPTQSPAPADTPAPPPTPVTPPESQPAQTAEVLPGIGSYASDFNGWTVKLDGTGSRQVLWSLDPDTQHDAKGTFWLAYMVYSNDSSAPRSLAGTLDFAMKGSDGNLYPEYTGRAGDPQRTKIAQALHANPLDFIAAPGQRTTTVLVFDLPPGVGPVQLIGRVLQGDSISPDGAVAWDLATVP